MAEFAAYRQLVRQAIGCDKCDLEDVESGPGGLRFPRNFLHRLNYCANLVVVVLESGRLGLAPHVPHTTKAELTRFIAAGLMPKAATLLAVCDVCVPISIVIAPTMGPATDMLPVKVLTITPSKAKVSPIRAENHGITKSVR